MIKRTWHKIHQFIFFDTYGQMSIGFFLICVISGILLAIPYDINSPYSSLGSMLIGNPWAVFFRNIHYWSAQFFLILMLLHSWEYIKESKKITLKSGIWFRLTISILITFWVMLSGFILKADTDSLQARRILESLISSIPFMGDIISYSILGPEGDFQIIYVHHIATTTIFLSIIILEHARTIWGKMKTFLILLIFSGIISYVFQAPLHNNYDLVMKGPWYFLGLQEILHWLGNPAISLIVILLVLLIIYFIPKIKTRYFISLKRILLYSFYIYILLTVIGYFFRGENWQWIWPWQKSHVEQIHTPYNFEPIISELNPGSFSENGIPEVLDRKESCLICHKGMEGFSPAHNPEAIGCVSCHGGNSFAMNSKQAHREMILIPGNLLDASKSCGNINCHPEIPDRVDKSLMATLSGMISVNRFVFDESSSLSELSNVHELGQSSADNHLRDLCASCHLGNEKIITGPITELTRGGGCNACHLNYSPSAMVSWNKYALAGRNDTANLKFHPSLSVKITNDHCFGCHSRSGRISTNYEGWHETQLEKSEVIGQAEYRLLEDQRVFEFVQDDVHHKKGMSCIDCHNSYELMGDGNIYLHKEAQVKIRCEDCHFENLPISAKLSELDAESKKIIELKNNIQTDQRFLKGKESGFALLNTYVTKEDSVFMLGKITGNKHPLAPPAEICTKGTAHDHLSCSACHTSWAPRCLGCHNEYEPKTPGFDIYANKETRGSWVEYVGKFLASPPTLGVETDTADNGIIHKTVKTAVPGMVLTIDKNTYTGKTDSEQYIFKRLFAPTEAHTIQTQGRSCSSCHNNALAIGYGEGTLNYDKTNGKWSFIAKYQENKYDKLPEDAWTGFLVNNLNNASTRENFRHFTLEEQKSILTVGACLSCHEENSKVMLESLDDFKNTLKNLSSSCILPRWE